MSLPHVHYLIIGGGLAASAAAQAIRQRDSQGSVLLIGQESSRPYHRPPLSKEFLRREKSREELFTLPADWMTGHDVTLRTGRRAVQLDSDRHTVALDSGQEISFDQLLLATGASPRALDIPGHLLPGVFSLRSIDDADRLQTAAAKAQHEGRPHRLDRSRGACVVVGGGVLGVELAASLRQMGLEVDLLVAGNWPWEKFAGESTGRFLTRYLEKHGVIVHTCQSARRIEGDGRAQSVQLGDGSSVACDFVIGAIGATANKDLLRGTPLGAGKAILVDDHCRTSAESVYAAGDCAAVFDRLFGKHRVLDHWDNATVTGTIAGTNMAGGDVRYQAVNYFFSDVFDLSLSAWGEGRQVDRRLMRGTPSVETPDFVEIGIAADGRVAQVLAVGHGGEDEWLKQLVGTRARIDGHEEAFKDPTTNLPELVRSCPAGL
jgi:3-phenylpropionate/trans-cinnamate dioxygenase ferredoxin reductase subunit